MATSRPRTRSFTGTSETWRTLTDAYRGAWQNNITYRRGHIVSYQGHFWLASFETNQDAFTFTATQWEMLSYPQPFGTAGQVLKINSGGNGLEWAADVGGGNADGVADDLTLAYTSDVLSVTIGRSIGNDLTDTVTIPSGGGGGTADGVVNAATLGIETGDVLELTLERSIGDDVTASVTLPEPPDAVPQPVNHRAAVASNSTTRNTSTTENLAGNVWRAEVDFDFHAASVRVRPNDADGTQYRGAMCIVALTGTTYTCDGRVYQMAAQGELSHEVGVAQDTTISLGFTLANGQLVGGNVNGVRSVYVSAGQLFMVATNVLIGNGAGIYADTDRGVDQDIFGRPVPTRILEHIGRVGQATGYPSPERRSPCRMRRLRR